MKRSFTVTVELPKGVDTGVMAQYIYDAVSNWTGGMDPEHLLGCVDIKPTVAYQNGGLTLKVEPKT